jgi:predicted negative regulator of RcsB-dependent stress response
MAVELYDEHEQSERVRSWIKEYGFSIVMGLVLAFGGIFGFRYWQDHQVNQRVLAAEYYEVIQRELDTGSMEFAEEQFQAMREAVSRSPYIGLAGMLMASAYVEDGRLEPAARSYREILDDRRLESLWPVTRLRLARVLQAQGDHSAALAQLEGDAPVGYQGAWAELRGDLLMAAGDLEQARLAYQEALDNLTGQGAGRRLIEMKIDATGPGVTENAS